MIAGQRNVQQSTSAWATVLRWLMLSGESKLAWLYLWGLAGGRPGTVKVHVGAVGENQGTSDRAGRNSLQQLSKHGLIKIIDSFRGQYTVYIFDPEEVSRARMAPRDDQAELDFDDQAGASASVQSPNRPEVSARLASEQCKTTLTPNTSMRALSSNTLRHDAGGFSAQTSGDSGMRELARRDAISRRDASEVFDSAADVERVVSQMPIRLAMTVEQPKQAEILAARIASEVGDPSLYPEIQLRVAWAIVEGKLPQQPVDALLKRINRRLSGKSSSERGKYFLGAMNKIFQQVGLQLFKERPAPRGPVAEEKGHGA